MKIGYYPGCSGDGSGIEYHLSTLKTALHLGVELIELDDWCCCGATSAHNTNKLLSLALPARNLAIAESQGLDTILAPCAACYNRFRTAELEARHDESLRQKIAQVIEMDFQASSETVSVLNWMTETVGLDEVRSKVRKSLKGMKAACYYGCLLVRPREFTGFDDTEDPRSMDDIMKALGAGVVDWSHKVECCGAALATSRPEIGRRMVFEVLRAARDAGAECLITACPLCMLNLDMRQEASLKAFRADFTMPVFYITEIAALAFGESPETIGVPRHFVDAMSYLATLPEKGRQIEEAEAAAVAAAAAKKKPTPKPAPKAKVQEEAADNAAAPNKAAPDGTGVAAATGVAPDTSVAHEAGGAAAEAASAASAEPEAPADDNSKKIAGMIKAMEKNPDKMAARMIEDPEKAAILAELLQADAKKTAKLAELMVTDKEKMAKAAEAFVSAELKKRAKG